MFRLVATDIDGTMLDGDGRLPEERRQALRRLREHGFSIAFATGKLWSSFAWMCEELALPGPHVACNGAVVTDGEGGFLSMRSLDAPVGAEVAAFLSRHDVPYAYYLEDGSVVTPVPRPELRVIEEFGEPRPVAGVPDGRAVLKILSLVTPEQQLSLNPPDFVGSRRQRTHGFFLEWTAPEADKSTGLRIVRQVLGVAASEMVGIGDAENDTGMLSEAGLGVAVRQASESAIAAADRHLTSDVAEFLHGLVDRPESAASSAVALPLG